MVEFNVGYYSPMDRQYHEQAFSDMRKRTQLEAPIVPISQIGQTVPEHDPAGRFKNIVQNVQAAIRGGAGNLQIVMMTSPDSPIGGRPKGYGEEVREAIREIALANKVVVSGIEMPTAMSNLSGYDPQRNVFIEERRKRDIQEVKDAIKFVADTAQGGGIDVLSWEYDRSFRDASWNEGKWKNSFQPIEKEDVERLVDKRTGRIMMIPKEETLELPFKKGFIDEKHRLGFDDKTGEIKTETWSWGDFKAAGTREKKAPAEIFMQMQIESQMSQYRYWERVHTERAHHATELIAQIEKAIPKLEDPLQVKDYQEKLADQRREYDVEARAAAGQRQQRADLEERQKNLVPVEKYANAKAAESYAVSGIAAFQETHSNPNAKRPVYVGPEIGWPHYYGSHPEEFIEHIRNSRKKMIELMTSKTMVIEEAGKERTVTNPYFQQGMSEKQAQEEAKTHIKGMVDTSHIGMWLEHFQTEKPWKERVANFEKWYMDQIDKLAEVNKKEQIIGGVQAVDSMSGAHGHLPAGQGILPVVKAVQKLRENGYTGYITSEGHEEERFGEGRILLKAWEAFGSPIGGSNYLAPQQRWGEVHNAYFGRTYSPMQMFGAYSPSNDFTLWSNVPLE